MKKAANIIQLVLTILAVFAIVVMVAVGAHNHHPTTFQTALEVVSLVVFYLWLLFSIVHLFTRIILKAVSIDKTGIEKKP
jgi:TRAP-type C4-dicarboxylate transport system permease small subunit